MLAEEWQRANPQTDAEIAQFYRDSMELRTELDEWHRDTPQRQVWTDFIVQTAQMNGVQSVLDVGCGGGHDLKALGAAGVTRLVGVEPNTALRCVLHAGQVFEKSSIESHDSLDTVDIPNGPDLTLCIDVLEHLPNPQAFIEQMCAHVPLGGLLIEATATHDIENPTHLKANWGWQPVGQLKALGFELAATLGRLRLWKRTAMSRPPVPALLMAIWRAMEIQTTSCVFEAAKAGFEWLATNNDALICRARAKVVADWWRLCNSDVFVMVDGDIVFTPADAQKLVDRCRAGHDIIAGCYVVRSGQHPSLKPYDGSEIVFEDGAEPTEIRWAATGFMAVHRRVIDALIASMRDDLCHAEELWAFWPLFQPFRHTETGYYLSEDWAFCERARELGFKVWVDPTIRIGHLGLREYRLEDMAQQERTAKAVILNSVKPEGEGSA